MASKANPHLCTKKKLMHNNNYVRNLYFKYHPEISLSPNYEYDKQTRSRFPKWGVQRTSC